MLEFITASANLPFSVALAMMMLLSVLEVLSFVFGASVAGFLDGLLHLDVDFDIDHAHGADIAEHSIGGQLMGWLHFGRVPVMVLLAIFLVCFGGLGMSLQASAHSVTGAFLPAWLGAAIALPISIPGVRIFGGLLARILPRDETQVTSQDAMIGRVATLVLGSARQGSAAQARVRDTHGKTHYVMLEPDDADVEFNAGDHVLLVSRTGATYRAILNTNPALSSED